MGHVVQGLVVKLAALPENVAEKWAALIPLEDGFGLVICGEWVDSDDGRIVPIEIEEFALSLSRVTPVAYVCTEYSGGTGVQSAAVYVNTCQIVAREPQDSSAINEALARIGVSPKGKYDCFDSIGLGRYRSNEDWVEVSKFGKLHWEK